jgi:hypothetical protein
VIAVSARQRRAITARVCSKRFDHQPTRPDDDHVAVIARRTPRSWGSAHLERVAGAAREFDDHGLTQPARARISGVRSPSAFAAMYSTTDASFPSRHRFSSPARTSLNWCRPARSQCGQDVGLELLAGDGGLPPPVAAAPPARVRLMM